MLTQRESVDTSHGLASPTTSGSQAPSQEGTSGPGDVPVASRARPVDLPPRGPQRWGSPGFS